MSTIDCLQWATGEGIGQYLCCTDTQGEGQNGKLYCTLCAVWLSSKGAILKDHVWVKTRNHYIVPMPGSLRLRLGFSFWKIWVPPTYSLKHAAACCCMANFSWGLLVLVLVKIIILGDKTVLQ